MKLLKTCISIFLISLVFALPVLAEETSGYEARLNALIENGVISQSEGNKQMAQLRSRGQHKFHNQVRGVASKIKDVKIYQIVNEPLEISSE